MKTLLLILALVSGGTVAVTGGRARAGGGTPVNGAASISPLEVDATTVKADAGIFVNVNDQQETAVTVIADAGYFSALNFGTAQGGTTTTSYADAGSVNVGGSAANFWRTNEICAGTSNATGCLTGPDIVWSPNSMFVCNATAGNAIKIFGTGVSINGSGGCTAGTFKNVLVSEGANMKRTECGSGAATAGVLASTFATAFSAAPICNCTHVGTTNTNACVITTGALPSTTNFSFTVTSGGTDVIQWCCTGDR